MTINVTFAITEKLRKELKISPLPKAESSELLDTQQIFFAVNFEFIEALSLYVFSIMNERTGEFLMLPFESISISEIQSEQDFGTLLMDLLYDAYENGGIAFNQSWSEELMKFFDKSPENFRFVKLQNYPASSQIPDQYHYPIQRLTGLHKSFKEKFLKQHHENIRTDVTNFVFSRKLLRYFKQQEALPLLPRDIPVQTLFQITYKIIQDRVHIYIINPLDQIMIHFEFSKFHKPSFNQLIEMINDAIKDAMAGHLEHDHSSFKSYLNHQAIRYLDGSKLDFTSFEKLIHDQTF
ncbi:MULTISPECIES: hypothetical protein [unclassified Enterococcus]|uniref:hypothetical protein n=1 Tax=unclassified Enterococcus TaxID=2608891 RepID=UPI0015532FBA|nr:MULTISPECIES: hypothetical protein [unclassified Enterococcus]MBS7577352.1 hypothetical protein [Enterococcus sp. MMGLQ5-2]MBS7584759.1 hypothetical protein [Enterococcus sp. MMGLQ5-1]NPD12614.1 hypothetical protein [Enterococcus sp. MMGLQ5-1]NPD37186.1 hypothetical protein [Enterococcus sp. MMGLQ5-2]